MYMPKSAVEVVPNPSAPGVYMPKSATEVEPEQNILQKLVSPIAKYGSMVGEAQLQATRFVANPALRRTTLPGVFGEPSAEDSARVAKLTPTFFMKPENLTGTRGDIALEGAKRTAGAGVLGPNRLVSIRL